MRLSANGLTLDLPAGWEAEAQASTRNEAGHLQRFGRDDAAPVDVDVRPALHVGSFALPALRGDFGSGAVDVMADGDVFVALVEYGTSEAGTALFARDGVPRRLAASDFSRARLQITDMRHVGAQVFCTEAGRALCLYAVLAGDRVERAALAAVNALLATLEVAPA